MATFEFLGPALHAALERELDARNMSFRWLAGQLRVSPAMFTRMANGARPDIDAAISMCHWLGRPVEDFALDLAAEDAVARSALEFADAEPQPSRAVVGA